MTNELQTQAAGRQEMQAMGLEPRNFAEVWDMSQALSKSALVPKALMGKPHDIMLVAMKGHELGVSMLSALASIHVIDGKPCLSSDLMQGVVQRSGKCRRFRLVESTAERATYEGERADNGEKCTMTWTLDDAKAAGLLGKQNWRTYPKAMLRARASSDLCRELWPDVCAGLYDLDEADDIRQNAGPAAAEIVDDGRPKRAKTTEDLKAQLKESLAPGAPGKPQAARAPKKAQEPRTVEIERDAPAQAAPFDQLPGHVRQSQDAGWDGRTASEAAQDEDPLADEPAPDAPAEPEDSKAHPLTFPESWYDPSVGGVDVNDDSELELQLGECALGRFEGWCGESVWTTGPLKEWTPAQAIMGSKDGKRHSLLKSAVKFALAKKFAPGQVPRGHQAADYCLALIERRIRVLSEAGVAS